MWKWTSNHGVTRDVNPLAIPSRSDMILSPLGASLTVFGFYPLTYQKDSSFVLVAQAWASPVRGRCFAPFFVFVFVKARIYSFRFWSRGASSKCWPWSRSVSWSVTTYLITSVTFMNVRYKCISKRVRVRTKPCEQSTNRKWSPSRCIYVTRVVNEFSCHLIYLSAKILDSRGDVVYS